MCRSFIQALGFGCVFGMTSCDGAPPAAPLPPADTAEAPSPDGAEGDWLTTVQTRIAAEARAIHSRDGAFAADLPSLGLAARLDADGVLVEDPDEAEPVLQLRTSAWGRNGLLTPVEGDREPGLGDCIADVDASGTCLRRLEYADPEMTEWWIGRGTGLEQGWTVDRAPTGEGTLTFEVTVDDALLVEGGGESATITDASGRVWSVEQVAAWDARGEALPATVSVSEVGLRIEVDDDGAAYPVTVDPVYATAAWTAVGTTGDAGFAGDLSGAGDVNGDGYDDVIVGVCGYLLDTGRAYLYTGSSTGFAANAATTLTGNTTSEYFGCSVASAGNVNGDGYDDVIVGAGSNASGTGRAYLYAGSTTGLSTTAMTTITGGTSFTHFGQSVAGAGDVNGDGYDDVVVGAPYDDDSYRSHAYVYAGSTSGVVTTPLAVRSEGSSYVYFGHSVAGAGDVNGDGYDDVIVGGYDDLAYVYLASASGLSTTANATLTGTNKSGFGRSVSGAGDVNGDGYSDVIVGANYYDDGTGAAYIYHGSSAGLAGTAATTLFESTTWTGFGKLVSGAGDVNGDGYDDVIVGFTNCALFDDCANVYGGSEIGVSPTAVTTLIGTAEFGMSVAGVGDSNSDGFADVIVGASYYPDIGKAYVYEGSSSGLSTIPANTWTAATSDRVGSSVASAGDLNADGYGDIVVGASGYSLNTGRAYVYLGSSSGLPTVAATSLTGEATYDYFGSSVTGAGDLNGDGYGDIVVGAYGYSSGKGRAYVYVGSTSGVSTTAVATLTGVGSYESASSLSGAGDTNGDGYDDIVVGDFESGYSTGRASVYVGSTSGLSTTATAVLTGDVDRRYFGSSVGGNGDVNGDGFGDIIIGAYGSSSSVGKAYVYLGSTSGFSTTATTVLTGEGKDNEFGLSVACVEDVNLDGFDEVIVGAPGYSSYTGRVYVYAGSASGVSTTAATAITGENKSDRFGRSVAAAGDLNGDSHGDVVVGASGYSNSAGRAYVYAGSTSGTGTTAANTLTGEGATNYFGFSVGSAGDVNGDGYDDIVVAAYGYADSAGKAYVFYGYAPDNDGDGVRENLDCDDSDISVGAGSTRFADADTDGYGDPDATALVCPSTLGYVDDSTDCDDTSSDVHPGATELCNGVDDNCDDLIDDPSAEDATTRFADADTDGYGDPDAAALVCPSTLGYVDDSTDCDDTSAAIHPDATELCNGIDDNCDDLTDDPSAEDAPTWYADADSDGHGDQDDTVVACSAPEGTVASSDDCDDTNAAIYPGATELCNGVDDSCDDLVDEALDCDTDVIVDTDDTDGDGANDSNGIEPAPTGCGCAHGGATGPAQSWVAAALLTAWRRRRVVQRLSNRPRSHP